VRLVVTLSQGSPFDGRYLSRFAAYLRKPTRRLPPLPAEYPSVHFMLWRKGADVVRFAYRYPADAFDASPAGPDVRVGPHRVIAGAGGTLALTVAAVPLPAGAGATRVSADLWFTPRFTSVSTAAVLCCGRPAFTSGCVPLKHEAPIVTRLSLLSLWP
jgi:hypothetical protein